MPVDHWMTFGSFAEQSHFAYPTPDAYRGVIINANMAAYASAGMAAFLMERTGGLSYLIDPLTHAFQHDPSAVQNKDGEVKASVTRVAEHYGEPFSSTVGIRPVLPEDFPPDIIPSFVGRVLNFQQTLLPTAMESCEANEYLGQSLADLQPHALLAPYFFLSETTVEEWLPVTRNLILASVAQKPAQSRLFVPLVLSQGVLLSDSATRQLLQAVNGVGVDGFVLWIDELNEHEASALILSKLVALARALRGASGMEVINLHGGYFSILAGGLLGQEAFSGVAHGPEFGEFRGVVPVGGGIPIAKYYMPPLHARVRYREAVDVIRRKQWLNSAQSFHQEVCDCSMCLEVLAGNPDNFILFGEATARQVRRGNGFARMEFPTTAAKQRCLRHYLQRKAIEYQFVRTASQQQILQDLDRGFNELRPIVGTSGVSHLHAWRTALTTPQG